MPAIFRLGTNGGMIAAARQGKFFSAAESLPSPAAAAIHIIHADAKHSLGGSVTAGIQPEQPNIHAADLLMFREAEAKLYLMNCRNRFRHRTRFRAGLAYRPGGTGRKPRDTVPHRITAGHAVIPKSIGIIDRTGITVIHRINSFQYP